LIFLKIDWFDLLAVQGTFRNLLHHHSLKASIRWHSAFFMVQLSQLHVTTGKTITLSILNYVGRVISLLFNTLPRFVITFLSRKNCLLISEEQREAKSKGERERYIQLNAEFQRTARRDKKAFFNEQCLIIEENNKRKKTRDLFRKIGNIEGAFFPKMCTIKDKNGRDIVC